MEKTNRRLLYLIPLLLAVALIVFGEALGDLWKEDVKSLFRQNKWLLLAFVLLLALVGYLWERRQQSGETTTTEAVDQDEYEKAFVQFRQNLLEQYQIRLRTKTANRLPVNLRAKSTHFGTDPGRVQAYFQDKELTIQSEDIASEVDKILQANDRLLLIGDPGSGKTTILLYAAINILGDANEPKLPLLLNLATWSSDRDFAGWYAQNIVQSYSLSPVFVQELLRRNAIVPFFDGFDEVAADDRNDCFQKMAAYFGDRRARQLIVSSRKKEYAAAKADAPVYAEIEVQPLSLAQIKKALTENAESQAADRALLHAIENDQWLAKAVETPFYLNTASFLFGKSQRTLSDFPFKALSTKGRQAELVETFVAEQLPEERDRKYLGFLAGKMNTENFLVFELVKMQPGWCGNLWRYRASLGLVFVLIFGLAGNLVFGLVFGLISSLFPITNRDIQIWSWDKFKKNWKLSLVFGLVFGLVGGLIFSWIGSWVLDWALGLGLASALVISLTFSFTYGGVKKSLSLHLSSPYQRFWAVLQIEFLMILIVILAVGVELFTGYVWEKEFLWNEFMALPKDWVFGLKLLPLSSLFLLIPVAFSNFPQHFTLRLVLYLENKMPLRVVTFMDRMSDQLIFEDNRRTDKKGKKRRGATWRFRHKILQDYFAKNSA